MIPIMRTGFDTNESFTTEQKNIIGILMSSVIESTAWHALLYCAHRHSQYSVTPEVILASLKYNVMHPLGKAKKLQAAFLECINTGTLSFEFLESHPEAMDAVKKHGGILYTIPKPQTKPKKSDVEQITENIIDHIFEKVDCENTEDSKDCENTEDSKEQNNVSDDDLDDDSDKDSDDAQYTDTDTDQSPEIVPNLMEGEHAKQCQCQAVCKPMIECHQQWDTWEPEPWQIHLQTAVNNAANSGKLPLE